MSIDQRYNRTSTLGIKYPKYLKVQDHFIKSGAKWLNEKQRIDGAESLWRIHDGLYDLTSFVNQHPGGPIWLKLTKGTDITEAFESHHLQPTAERTLPKFFVRNAITPRNSPFTFKDNGFYKTLKRNVVKVLDKTPTWPGKRSKIIADLLFIHYISFAFIAIYLRSLAIGTMAGAILAILAIVAHNFFHKRDNFRMYYFDLSLLQSRSWRISHALSHHMYPNTIIDFEILAFEPYFFYLPKKSKILRYTSWFLSPLVYGLTSTGNYVLEVVACISGEGEFSVTYALPFSVPMSVTLITGTPFLQGIMTFAWIIFSCSFFFTLIGVNAAHHHPDIFHDGDAARPRDELDWGVHQLDTVMDRNEVTGSHFLVLTSFGDHALHHLFPTVDHGLLNYLYPVLRETCDQFGIKFKMKSQMELFLGQFRQLVKVLPNPRPPAPLKVIN